MDPIKDLEYADATSVGSTDDGGYPPLHRRNGRAGGATSNGHGDHGGVPVATPSDLPDAALSDITHLLVSEGPPDRVLEAVADALSELVPHDTLSLFQAEPPLRVLRPVLVRDTYAQEILAMGSIRTGRGSPGWPPSPVPRSSPTMRTSTLAPRRSQGRRSSPSRCWPSRCWPGRR